MVVLYLYNSYVRIKDADRKIIRAIESRTSYFVAGAFYSSAFKARRWDGKEHLLKYSTKLGYHIPSGLLNDVIGVLKEHNVDYKIINERRKPKKNSSMYSWNDSIKLRKYQRQAIKAATKKRKQRARGILSMPVRSGKTKTAAGIIKKLSVKTLFIVPSQLLLYQTQKSLQESLLVDVGVIGDGEWNECDITVATAQTLNINRGREETIGKKKIRHPPTERYKELCGNYGLIIFDECHHLVARTWKDIAFDIDAPYVIGLSATAELTNERQVELGVIWLKAICGDVLYHVGTSELIELGYLQQPTIEIYPIEFPDNIADRGWSGDLSKLAISNNKYRNELIAKIARKKIDLGLNVLAITNRLNQVSAIGREFDKLNIQYHTIIGRNSSYERRPMIDDFKKGKVDAIIGTIFGEGVDIPEISVVINAEGGADIKTTIQRMRNLTPHENKTEAIFVDFLDLTNPYFAKHSQARLDAYRREKLFKIKYKRPF